MLLPGRFRGDEGRGRKVKEERRGREGEDGMEKEERCGEMRESEKKAEKNERAEIGG